MSNSYCHHRNRVSQSLYAEHLVTSRSPVDVRGIKGAGPFPSLCVSLSLSLRAPARLHLLESGSTAVTRKMIRVL